MAEGVAVDPTDNVAAASSILLLFASNTVLSFWLSMMLPAILSLPLMNAFMGSSLPLKRLTKSASDMVRVQSALGLAAPAYTDPLPFFRSKVHCPTILPALVMFH